MQAALFYFTPFVLAGSATAATATVIVSAHLTTAAVAVVTAIAVTEEENKDDEKTPVVIASATHESDLRFRLSGFYQPLTSTSYVRNRNVLQKSFILFNRLKELVCHRDCFACAEL